jgi:hypothetical protein
MSNLPAELQFQFKDHNELSHIMEQEANNPSIEVSIDDVVDVEEDVIQPIEFVEKPPINTKDIFISEPEPEPKPEPEVIVENKNIETNETEPNFEYEGDVIQKVEVKPVKMNKNGKPRKKREYTPEQRKAMCERLAKARSQVGKTSKKKKLEKAIEKEKELKKKRKKK